LILPGISPAPKPIRFFGYRETGNPGNARSKAMVRTFKVMLVALVVLVLAGSAYAFAAANTIAKSNAGYLASGVSGYAVAGIVYDLNTTTPTQLDKIIFTLAPIAPNDAAPVTVKISTVTGTKNFGTSECVVSGSSTPWTVTCTFGTVETPAAINFADVVALDVIASSSANPAP
jgi:hypothetical protein